MLVRLSRLGKSGVNATLKLGASSESWRIIRSKTVRSIKAKREKTGISSSCMKVIQVIDVWKAGQKKIVLENYD